MNNKTLNIGLSSIGQRIIIKYWEETEKREYKTEELYSKDTFNAAPFIEAGDYLISKYPSFKWNKSNNEYKILPQNKSYLSCVTTSEERLDEYLKENRKSTEKIIDDEWVNTSLGNKEPQKLEYYLKEDDDFIIDFQDDDGFAIESEENSEKKIILFNVGEKIEKRKIQKRNS